MVQVIANFEALRPKLEQVLKGEGVPLGSVLLDAPLVWPHKLMAYPVNYLAHGHEMNSKNRKRSTNYEYMPKRYTTPFRILRYF